MDTKKLRQKILDLAIHGKLVPQDPNDEPASVLLERIKAEKERLIKEGKIKRTKKSAKSSDTPHYGNLPFEVPDNWVWTTLGEIFNLQAGKNITAKDISTKQDRIHCYPCYGGNGLRGYVSNYNREGWFPLIGRQGALCGNINEANGKFYATEHAVVVDTYCKTNINWAINTLLYLNLNQYATSTAQPGLSVNTINEVMIPVPPLEEQERISQSIKDWFALINKIEQSQSDLQTTIKQTKSKILDLAIHGKLVPQAPHDEPASELLKRINPKAEITCDNGHSKKLPQSWIICRLGEICKVENGYAFSSDEYKPFGTPLVRISNIVNDKIDLSSCVFIQGDVEEKFIVSKGDLLIAMSGATTGKMGIYSQNEISYLNQRVGNIKILNKDLLLPEYRNYFMISKMDDILKLAYGGAQPNISAKIISNFLLPLPPISEQQRIVAKIEELFSVLDSIKKSLEA